MTDTLHKFSPSIFYISFALSITIVFSILRISFTNKIDTDVKIVAPVLLIKVENIPKTQQTTGLNIPAKPYIPGSMPIPVEKEFTPDILTIENTSLDQSVSAISANASSSGQGIDVKQEEPDNKIYEMNSVDVKPERLNSIIPDYPSIAERAGIEGSVVLKALISKKGTVDSVEVLKGNKLFNDSAIAAAKKTLFKPASVKGKPVASWVIIPYKFEYQSE